MKNTTSKKPILYFVIPCYNEEAVLPLTYKIFLNKMSDLISRNMISKKSRVLFVNDGSSDSTWDIIKDLSGKHTLIEGISLSRNYGHQYALLAGLMEAKELCDVTITMDADGQHDISSVDEMLQKYLEGNEIVYGVRKRRTGDSFLKKIFSEGYYRIINLLGGNIINNHADYRLVSSVVLNEFKSFKEVNVFLRGLFPMVGYRHCIVEYDQFDRAAGKSHYTLRKMLTLAIDGITSLSIQPIRYITVFGVIVSVISLFIIIHNILTDDRIMTAISILYLLSGLLFVALGIVGEYVGKTYMEAKHRPRYIVSDRTF